MSQLLEVAREHADFRRRVAVAAAGESVRAWRRVDPARISESWLAQIARLLVLLTGAQQAVAGRADTYLDEVLDTQHLAVASEGAVSAAALAGVASDGRGLGDLLFRPVITSLTAIGAGAGPQRALAAGQATLDMIVRTQVADAGRAADQVAMVARPQATVFVRMLVGGSCARCAILAGRRYRWNATFDRHPRCDCTAVPGQEDTADDIRTDPKRYFASLSAAEQDKAFTKAGAESIRLGADMSQVVNARSGMYSASGKSLTRSAATSRGRRGVRLMPEQILIEAKGDRGEALRLLKLHGYLRT